MTSAGDDAERSDEVGVRPLATGRLGVPPAACGRNSRGWMYEGGAGERRRHSPASWFGCLGA